MILTNIFFRFLQEIGAKQRIMELMTYEDSEVRYQALLAVQKYMTHAWYTYIYLFIYINIAFHIEKN